MKSFSNPLGQTYVSIRNTLVAAHSKVQTIMARFEL
jgi:hypothetical protein